MVLGKVVYFITLGLILFGPIVKGHIMMGSSENQCILVSQDPAVKKLPYLSV